MKSIIIATIATIIALSCVSCDSSPTDDDFGIDAMTRSAKSVSLVFVDSVKIADDSKIVNVDDSINVKPESIDLSKAKMQVSVLSEKIIKREQSYAVKQLDCLLSLSLANLSLPLRFQRQIVVSIDEKGDEYTPYYSFAFQFITAKYRGSESMITFEENYSRSYYDIALKVMDKDEAIGTLVTRVSFYTANTPVSFDADVSDWDQVY